MNGDQLTVDALRVASSANKSAVDGLLGQSSGALVISIEMPTLSTLWPTLGGNLKGNPTTGWLEESDSKIRSKGKGLQFAGHRSGNHWLCG